LPGGRRIGGWSCTASPEGGGAGGGPRPGNVNHREAPLVA
jgi:hypothetical protein